MKVSRHAWHCIICMPPDLTTVISPTDRRVPLIPLSITDILKYIGDGVDEILFTVAKLKSIDKSAKLMITRYVTRKS